MYGHGLSESTLTFPLLSVWTFGPAFIGATSEENSDPPASPVSSKREE